MALVGEGGSPRPAFAAAPARDGGPVDGVPLRRLTLSGGMLVFLALFLIEDLSPTFLLALTPLLALSWLFHERKKFIVPKRLWDVLSVGMLLFLLLVDWRRYGVTLANAHLLLGPAFAFLETTIVPEYKGFLLMILPPGGFMALGFLLAAKRVYDRRRSERLAVAAQEA